MAFGEALRPDFPGYARDVVDNAKTLGATLVESGLALVSGGTDSMSCWSTCGRRALTGNIAEKSLEHAGITCNKNAIPFDPEKPMVTSGIRLGSRRPRPRVRPGGVSARSAA